jgi:hypothetical protein
LLNKKIKERRRTSDALAGLLDFDPLTAAPLAMVFVLSRFVLLVPGPFPAVWMDRRLRSGIIVVPLACQPPFTVARDLADAVAALKAREPAATPTTCARPLSTEHEVDEPEVVAAPMLPPTMRVTLGSRSGEL